MDRARNGGAEIAAPPERKRSTPCRRRGREMEASCRPEARTPLRAYLQGEYGLDDLFVGVPVKLGASGVEEIVDLDLQEDELADLNNSADAVRELVQVLRG